MELFAWLTQLKDTMWDISSSIKIAHLLSESRIQVVGAKGKQIK